MSFDTEECGRHAAHCRQLAAKDCLFLPSEIFIDLAKRWEWLAAERQTLTTERALTLDRMSTVTVLNIWADGDQVASFDLQ
jgi:hypothetical protein